MDHCRRPPIEADLRPYAEQARRLNERLRALPIPSFDSPRAIDAVRARVAELAGLAAFADPAVPVRRAHVPGEDADVPVRIFAPDHPAAVYLQIHGGGWITGCAALGDADNARIAVECGLAVVSVDYRLAPEFPYPAALHDCVTVAHWLLREAPGTFGTGALLIGGESVGATLAVLTMLALHRAGADTTRLRAADLRYGVYDWTMTPSQRAAVDTPLIDRRYLEQTRPLIFPGLDDERLRDPAISPLHADRAALAALPPALFTVGELDPFVDDSLLMAARLRAAGTPARARVYPASPHGFASLDTGMAAACRAHTDAFLRAHAAR